MSYELARSARRVDFHTHFLEDKVQEVFTKAKKAHVVAMALIGRLEIPNVDDMNKIVELGQEQGIKVFSGVEYLARINGVRADLVALGFDCGNPAIKKHFGKEENRQRNVEIANKQLSFLIDQGFDLSAPEKSEKQVLLRQILAGDISEKAINLCRVVCSTSVNVRSIDELKKEFNEEWNGVVSKYSNRPGFETDGELEAKFLYLHYFDIGKPGFQSVQRGSEEVIEAVHQSGGVILYSPEGKFNNEVWEILMGQGIDGIMGWHGGKLELNHGVSKARAIGLLVLGGSDYNPVRNEWQPGVGKGDMYISPRRLKELELYLERIRTKNKNAGNL